MIYFVYDDDGEFLDVYDWTPDECKKYLDKNFHHEAFLEEELLDDFEDSSDDDEFFDDD